MALLYILYCWKYCTVWQCRKAVALEPRGCMDNLQQVLLTRSNCLQDASDYRACLGLGYCLDVPQTETNKTKIVEGNIHI